MRKGAALVMVVMGSLLSKERTFCCCSWKHLPSSCTCCFVLVLFCYGKTSGQEYVTGHFIHCTAIKEEKPLFRWQVLWTKSMRASCFLSPCAHFYFPALGVIGVGLSLEGFWSCQVLVSFYSELPRDSG